jgi:hypothetical protein
MLAGGILLLVWLIYDETVGYNKRRAEKVGQARFSIMCREIRLAEEKDKRINREIKEMLAWQSELDDSYIRAFSEGHTDEL